MVTVICGGPPGPVIKVSTWPGTRRAVDRGGRELDLVVVTTADPLYGETGDGPWNHEKSIINLVTDFIASLPEG